MCLKDHNFLPKHCHFTFFETNLRQIYHSIKNLIDRSSQFNLILNSEESPINLNLDWVVFHYHYWASLNYHHQHVIDQ